MPDLLAEMGRLIRHRGPDDEGYVLHDVPSRTLQVMAGVDTPASVREAGFPYSPGGLTTECREATGNVGLGHRRLSIVDLSPAGHQPMCSEDRRYWIVYNGEVYNHVELRAELEAAGCRFLSHSDTEVILHAYRLWGPECLHRFNGMFAFVLFDRIARRLFVARDRFGVKPLYFWRSPAGLLAFASEIKQFTCLPGWAARLNGPRAYDYLNWGLFDHTDETLFAGVRQLRGGEFVECGLDALNTDVPVRRWYNYPAQSFAGSFVEAAAEFRRLFADAVRLRLRSDVPVGSCLSGGLDSSAIVCVASDVLRTQGGAAGQRTFSACAREKKYDERSYAEEVAAAAGAQPVYTYPEPAGLLAELDALTWHQDEPFGSTSIYAQWSVFRSAAEAGVKVMLDGQGADEQLAGYHRYFSAWLAELAQGGHLGRLAHEVRAMRRVHGLGWGFAARSLANHFLPEGLRQSLRSSVGAMAATPAWLDLELLGAEAGDPRRGETQGGGRVAGVGRAQMLHTNLPMLLHWEDRDSMAHSVESRVPFLDYRLAEFLAGLPSEYKISGGQTKRVLRAAMEGILPERVRTRQDKMGFVTPEEVWVRQTYTELFRTRIRECIALSGGVVRPAALTEFEGIVRGQLPFSYMPWRVVSFGAWWQRFNVQLS